VKNLITLFSLLLLFTSCQIRPKEINFGEDSCHYCSMTIVDRQHPAELVTHKGKVYKFDAAECMINSLSEMDPESIALFLVTDYSAPEQFIDAKTATFIVSPEIPSPMRANLSALESKEKAISLQKSKQGSLYTWEEIQLYLKNK
jgi:copper chaperone NosL